MFPLFHIPGDQATTYPDALPEVYLIGVIDWVEKSAGCVGDNVIIIEANESNAVETRRLATVLARDFELETCCPYEIRERRIRIVVDEADVLPDGTLDYLDVDKTMRNSSEYNDIRHAIKRAYGEERIQTNDRMRREDSHPQFVRRVTQLWDENERIIFMLLIEASTVNRTDILHP